MGRAVLSEVRVWYGAAVLFSKSLSDRTEWSLGTKRIHKGNEKGSKGCFLLQVSPNPRAGSSEFSRLSERLRVMRLGQGHAGTGHSDRGCESVVLLKGQVSFHPCVQRHPSDLSEQPSPEKARTEVTVVIPGSITQGSLSHFICGNFGNLVVLMMVVWGCWRGMNEIWRCTMVYHQLYHSLCQQMISDVRRSIHYLAKDAGILQTVGYIQAVLLLWLGSPLALPEGMVTMFVGKPSHLPAFVRTIEDHFFTEMVRIPTELEVSVSNTFPVEVRHTALLLESEIGHITGSVKSLSLHRVSPQPQGTPKVWAVDKEEEERDLLIVKYDLLLESVSSARTGAMQLGLGLSKSRKAVTSQIDPGPTSVGAECTWYNIQNSLCRLWHSMGWDQYTVGAGGTNSSSGSLGGFLACFCLCVLHCLHGH
ncbi:hypothetical protein EK904_008080 [Melospiza melodia maxima]|nr:hypothetical protein EK904_008080 [Melospiza melodia maxima]